MSERDIKQIDVIAYRVDIEDALDWEFPTERDATSLRAALVDAAETALGVEDAEGTIKVAVDGDKQEFVMTFEPALDDERKKQNREVAVYASASEADANANWLNNAIQFPRLISEIIAVGLHEDQWDGLCASMDLESDDLSELFDRAQAEWERIKEATCPK